MKLHESCIGEVVVFVVVVGFIGGICALILVPFALWGMWTTIFDVKDQP
jgi:hypothetical protein